ncbi:MAG: type II secretion system F family protein [Candidatus Omnitrophica bacterium]|nr:type II secretion system F family protein [Candidatus Omnitrophota bacterium]
MPVYLYRAKKGPEEIVEGRIEAGSEKEAIEKLVQLGYIPTRLELFRASEGKTPTFKKERHFKVKGRQVTIFSRQLASLLKSGVPILSAINTLQQQSDNPYLRYILSEIYNSLKEGATLSSSLSQYPNVFPAIYIALIKTGEDSGALPEVLLRIAEYRYKQEEFLGKFRMALIYPLFMILVGVGTIIFMLTFVLPRISQIFVNLKQQLPLATRIVLAVSNFLKTNFFWLALGLFVVMEIIRRYIKTEKGKINWDKIKLKLPLLGKFILKTELARFSRTLELLIKSGLSVIRAIELSVAVVENKILRTCFYNSLKELKQGGSFSKSLKNYSLIPPFMSNLIGVGEESARLAEAMEELANSYEQDTEDTIKVFTTLLEPLLILFIGAIIGFIVIAMLLPIFEMNLAIR